MKTVTENNNSANTLIAEFLHGKDAVHPNQYHENWNELMKVVEKIENTEMTGFKILDEFRIESFQVVVRAWITPKHKLYKLIEIKESKIEAVYNAVVAFIEWYNISAKEE